MTSNSKLNFDHLNLNILILEDSKSLNKVLYNEFKDLGYQCFSASLLKEAKNIIESNRIDYLLLDINLPDGNGYELIEQLENSNTKIFVLSAERNKQFQEKSYKKGIIDYITKDENFFYNISSIDKTIEKLEKNKQKTVLVIDDSLIIQEQVKEILFKRHYTIEVASDIDSALSIIVEKDISLIILDVQLKNANGIEFLKSQNAQIIVKKEIPIIIISGFVDASIIRDGLNAGAVDVIRKPLIFEEIILKVDLWVDYKRKEKEVNDSTKLLKQYKEAVDKNFIVSKTDSEGIITYVNAELCDVSGYKKEELIGKTHNIIRHKDIKKTHFDKMWEKIKKDKKSWNGKTKNISKNGDTYWISTSINPVFDSNNNLIEYISISSNITEHEKIKKYFKNQLNSSSKNLTQAINLSTEYKKAMDESSIVSRTDLNGVITYVNDKFIKISEYSKNELIGQKHSFLIHPDTKENVYSNLWETLKSGKSWNGVIKNLSKTGKSYWVNSTMVPIKDKDNNIIEYMSIRNDISEIFELHKEIDLTQKEIIYRMGEIGETRSKETGNHVKRVAEYSKLLAKYSNLSQEDIDILFTASPMHDIGKVGIPDTILTKPGKLTFEEFEIMKDHAMIGYNILNGSEREVLKAASIVSKEHHEKWDGSGYPDGLKGENIHIFGRITAVADVFDALGSERCYKQAWDNDKIFKLFHEEKGKSFDPKLIDIFFENVDEFLSIRDRYKD